MTFSVIVPVYNVEKYLAKCLESILNQSFGDFEIIVVNDGSPDNSQAIIDEYSKEYPEKIKSYIKENGGLSDARNFGIQRASGDYLLFVDSDDYISCDLLCRLKTVIERDDADVVRFGAQILFENGDIGERFCCPELSCISGNEAINALIDNKQMFEPAPFYAYKRQFWKEENFAFANGRYHEDFGLIPEVIMKAEKFSSIDFIGYYYVQSSSSIMRTVNTEKDNKRAFDGLHHFDHLFCVAQQHIKKDSIRNKFNSYIANSVITRINHVYGPIRKEYISELLERRVFDMLLSDTLKRKIKKIIIKSKYSYRG